MATAVYVLCALTSLACAVLLLRAWRATRQRLLLWSALCFLFLAVNNVLLPIDLLVVPDVDLSLLRTGSACAGFAVLLLGLVWETGR